MDVAKINWAANIITGLTSGTVVICGVLISAWLEKLRARRWAVENAFQRLRLPLSKVAVGVSTNDLSGEFESAYMDVRGRLDEIQLQSRGFRRAKGCRTEALRLSYLIGYGTMKVRLERTELSVRFIGLTNAVQLELAIFGRLASPPKKLRDEILKELDIQIPDAGTMTPS